MHPISVAKLVSQYNDDTETIAAALLHDTVEDCNVSIEDITNLFGNQVGTYVDYLTESKDLSIGNRKYRKKIVREKLSAAPSNVQDIKIADLIDNSISISEYDPKFYIVFRTEAELLLNALTRANSNLQELLRIRLSPR